MSNREKAICIINEIDSLARDYDYEYGLPYHNPEEMEKMILIVLKHMELNKGS